MDDSLLNIFKTFSHQSSGQRTLTGILCGLLVLAGFAAVAWGLLNLVKTSQVPVCVQPVDEKIASESSMASRHG